MKTIIKSTLKFFNLLDHNSNCLSLTNVLIYCSMIYIAVNPHIDLTALGAFVTILMNYAHKRHVSSKASDDYQIQYKHALEQIETKTQAYELQMTNIQQVALAQANAIKEVDNKVSAIQINAGLTSSMINRPNTISRGEPPVFPNQLKK